MNADRAIRMVMNLLFRQGIRYLNKGGKTDPKMAEAAKRLKQGRRIGRFLK
mgnify:CR=1 FL=1